ncbi:MAG: DUF4079 family protein [Alphaproteobacteria bacterium]|nr:DUF4079 family protein [Alphaproteobacteria bacterium]
MAYVHPVLGVCAVILTAFLASRGLVARQGARNATSARRLHKRMGPWVLALMWIAAVGGTVTTALWRPDLELGETWHLVLGWGSVLVMSTAALSTRAFSRRPSVRRIHPWIGVTALVLTLAQALTGIELLP